MQLKFQQQIVSKLTRAESSNEFFPSLGVWHLFIIILILFSRSTGPNWTTFGCDTPLYGPLPKFCPVIPTSNQDGHQAKNRKRGDEIKKNYSPLKLLSQSQPNFAEMILGWSPFKIVSISADLYPRWPPLLKIEISSNGSK
jgi:hypothetical protein